MIQNLKTEHEDQLFEKQARAAFELFDEDGGGTLDCGEIQSLFVQNGIHMTVEEVANMFGEATRMDASAKFRKLL